MNEVVSQLVNRETTCIKLTHLSPYSDQAADFLAQGMFFFCFLALMFLLLSSPPIKPPPSCRLVCIELNPGPGHSAYAGDEWLVVDECGPQLRASIKMWLESKEFALYNRHIVDDNKPVFDALKSCQAKELEKVRDVLQHLPIICPSEVTAPSWRGVKREERPVSITGRRSGHGTISLLMSFTTARKKRSAVKVSRLMKALFDPASRPDKAALGDKKYAAITLSHLSTTIGDRPIARCDVNPFRTVYEDKDVNRGRGNCAVEFQTAVEKAEWKAAAASVKCSHQPPCTFYDFTAGAWATAQAAYISLHEKKQEIANKNKVNKTTAADSISQSRDKYKTNSSVMYFMLCSLRNGVASEDVFGDDLEGTLEAAGVDLADSADEEDELEEAELDVHYALVRSIMGGNKDKKSHGLYCCFVCKKDSREGKLERESANLRLHLKEHGLHLGRLQSGHKAAGQYARKKRSRDEDAEEEEEYDPPAASAAAAAATYPRQQ